MRQGAGAQGPAKRSGRARQGGRGRQARPDLVGGRGEGPEQPRPIPGANRRRRGRRRPRQGHRRSRADSRREPADGAAHGIPPPPPPHQGRAHCAEAIRARPRRIRGARRGEAAARGLEEGGRGGRKGNAAAATVQPNPAPRYSLQGGTAPVQGIACRGMRRGPLFPHPGRRAPLSAPHKFAPAPRLPAWAARKGAGGKAEQLPVCASYSASTPTASAPWK